VRCVPGSVRCCSAACCSWRCGAWQRLASSPRVAPQFVRGWRAGVRCTAPARAHGSRRSGAGSGGRLPPEAAGSPAHGRHDPDGEQPAPAPGASRHDRDAHRASALLSHRPSRPAFRRAVRARRPDRAGERHLPRGRPARDLRDVAVHSSGGSTGRRNGQRLGAPWWPSGRNQVRGARPAREDPAPAGQLHDHRQAR
jgi:hypothetical protein